VKVVIVGGGLAGHRAASALARAGFDGEVVIVGEERHHPYDRPPLSKTFLAGVVEYEECSYSLDDLDGVTWTLGKPAVRLDAKASRLYLSDGDELSYDRLVIATGRAARQWPGELPELDGFHTLRTVDDSRALAKAAKAGKRVAIVGAGFIGCEVAATLRRAERAEVTVIEHAEHPMPVIGKEAGERAAKLHRDNGVRLELGTSVEGFDGAGRVEAVRLKGGECVPADLVLLALGAVPSTDWLRDSGLELKSGAVLCDEYCFAVGTDNVVAAGDVAAWPHPDVDGPVSIEHWTNARAMGAAAARNLVADPGDRTRYAAVPSFWSDQYDVKIKSVGFLNRADCFKVIDEDTDKRALVVEAQRDGELVGAITFNRNRTLLEYQRKLRARVPA